MKKNIMLVFSAATLFGIGCSSNQPVALSAAAADNNQTITGSAGSLRLNMSNGDDDTIIAKKKVAGINQQTDVVEHIWITIKEVQLHIAGDSSENGWKTVATPNKKFDFLQLVNGLTEPLDLYALPAGHYTQIRLLLGDEAEDNYGTAIPANTIVVNGERFPLTIPSAYTTGIKCVRSFFIEENEVTEICLAIDVLKAIHFSPGNGYMMKLAYKTFNCDGSGKSDESVKVIYNETNGNGYIF
jgi:hypothetical protein